MDFINYFKKLFQSILDYTKIVLIFFKIKIDNDLLEENDFLKNDINRLNKEFKNILFKQNTEYLNYTKNEEESIIERGLNQ